jgi:hypothetical protein
MPWTWFAIHLFGIDTCVAAIAGLWKLTAVAAFVLVLPEILSKASELELCLHV